MDNKKILVSVLLAIIFIIITTSFVLMIKPKMHKKIMVEKIIIKKEVLNK